MTIPEDFVAMLVCPDTKAPVVEKDGWLYSTDRGSRRRYPIRDGIPVMVIDESEVISQEEFDRIMKQTGSAVR